MLRLCVLILCLSLIAPAIANVFTNISVPLEDPERPGCREMFLWRRVYSQGDFQVWENKCAEVDARTRLLPITAFYSFAKVIKERTEIGEEIDFYVEAAKGKYCGVGAMEIVRPSTFVLRYTSKTSTGLKCARTESTMVNHVVCYKKICPPPATTSTTTTLAPVTTVTTETPVGALQVGTLGLSVDSEILLYRIAVGILLLILLLLIILLIRTCSQLRRANAKQAMSDGRSHVSIRRVTEAVVDPYSSMAGIAETSSLGGQEFYGSIARRKELCRDRKTWLLRDHPCGGSHIGVPPPEDMNGLLPAQGGSVHRTSITSLTQGGHGSIHGPNGSLSRVPGMRSPPGTYPVRPSACQLSRQNTADSLHCRSHMTPQPMMLPPSPGANGHANSLSRDEMEGHMV